MRQKVLLGALLFFMIAGGILPWLLPLLQAKMDYRYEFTRGIEAEFPGIYVVDFKEPNVGTTGTSTVKVTFTFDRRVTSKWKRDPETGKSVIFDFMGLVNRWTIRHLTRKGYQSYTISYAYIAEVPLFYGEGYQAQVIYAAQGTSDGMKRWAEAGGTMEALPEVAGEDLEYYVTNPYMQPVEHTGYLKRLPFEGPPLWIKLTQYEAEKAPKTTTWRALFIGLQQWLQERLQ